MHDSIVDPDTLNKEAHATVIHVQNRKKLRVSEREREREKKTKLSFFKLSCGLGNGLRSPSHHEHVAQDEDQRYGV